MNSSAKWVITFAAEPPLTIHVVTLLPNILVMLKSRLADGTKRIDHHR